MATLTRSLTASAFEGLLQLARNGRIQTAVTVVLVMLGPVLAALTVTALSDVDAPGGARLSLRAIILVDLVYVIVVTGLVSVRIARMITERRRRSAGSRLHQRLMLVFSVVALAPTVLVAIFATITINFGIETWFSDRVRTVLGTSLATAQAYEAEHRANLEADARLLADFLNASKDRRPLISSGELREALARGQTQMQREITEAFVIDGMGEIVVRGDESYLFDYEAPGLPALDAADRGEIQMIADWPNNELRALVYLSSFVDRYLYVTRRVDGNILTLLDETKDTVSFYQQLERERGRLLFEFALIYIGFALLVIVAAIWLGLWFADRLASPVGRLAGAARRVGSGDLDVRVEEEPGDDEIAMLARMFNRMTEQVKGQRDALVAANAETERRRRLFAAVLSGVTAGVIGLDADGKVEVMNGAAGRMLGVDHETTTGPLNRVAPALAALFSRMQREGHPVMQDQVHLMHNGAPLHLLARIASRSLRGITEGYVVTFDDVTDLVTAQRMAAWGDVARRIAHEIKNPLTPIQLSAERLRRKYAPKLGEDADGLEQYADVIIRQTNDLRRIVDEFSQFARMPAPETRMADLVVIVRDAVLLQQAARSDIVFDLALPDGALTVELDPTMMSQVLTNLLKNATEAIDARHAAMTAAVTDTVAVEARDGVAGAPTFADCVDIRLESRGGEAVLSIRDTGIGWPKHERTRLFEPYVTTREKGTGLGLPIVRKVVEDHFGRIELLDGPGAEGSPARGAMVRIVLPVPKQERQNEAAQAASAGMTG
ncbi:MAG: PAS domain-containing sensor histidine kinase [Pseudomonadota bacterium]